MPKPSAAPSILRAAEACFIAGCGDFEMLSVTDYAKVSEGLVYHYFKSKTGLMTALVNDFYGRYAAIANQHWDRDVAWSVREKARLSSVVDFFYDDPMARLLLSGQTAVPGAAAAGRANRLDIAERSIRNIKSGQEQGVIPMSVKADVAGPAIIGAMDQVVFHSLSRPELQDREVVKQELWSIICAIVHLRDTG